MATVRVDLEGDPFLEKEIEMFIRMNPKSNEYWRKACQYLPGGATRGLSYFPPFPPYVAKGNGCWVYDMDGNKRLDLFCNATSLILGHAHPAVVKAVQEQVSRGTAFTFPNEHEVELANILCERIPSVERIRFCNSGSEATMMTYRTARTFTGKSKIGKIEGGYQGSHDFAEVSTHPALSDAGDPLEPRSVPDTLGLPPSIAREMVVLPFNNLEAVEKIIEKKKDDLAGVMVEPVMGRGYVPADKDFLGGLREITKRYNIVLMFDEVQTFRLAPGGAQELYGVVPDLTALGKIIGGGFPVGGFGGRAEIMALFDQSEGGTARTLTHHGTFNGNPITTAAGVATMKELKPEVYERLSHTGEEMRREIKTLCDEHGIEAQVTGEGSLFKIHFTDQPITDYRSWLADDKKMEQRLFYFCMNRGVYIESSARVALSVPVRKEQVAHFLSVFNDFLEAVKKE
jgi:glutamate-1-semialdehyde 2,1-aminomutase